VDENGPGGPPRYRGAADLLLFLAALPLARRAQRVRDTRLPDVVAAMAARGALHRGLPVLDLLPRPAGGVDAGASNGLRTVDTERVARAAGRATARWARWFGGLDSCLTRSLVAGGMLAGAGEVVLQVGFRPGEPERTVDGHAWVTVDGRPVGPDGQLAEERYERVLEIPFGAAGGGAS